MIWATRATSRTKKTGKVTSTITDKFGISTGDTQVVTLSYDWQANTFTGSWARTKATDINKGAGLVSVGGTFSVGQSVAVTLDVQKAKDLKNIIMTAIFGGKGDSVDEAGEPSVASCDACVWTIMENLNHKAQRDKCSKYNSIEDVAACKYVKEEIEGLYMAFGFLQKSRKWFTKERDSSTWQYFEPHFRNLLCKKQVDKVKGTDNVERSFGVQPHLWVPENKQISTGCADAPKKDYCDNECSADWWKHTTGAAATAKCRNSWVGFCQMMNFCPTNLMNAVDAYKKRVKVKAVKDLGEFSSLNPPAKILGFTKDGKVKTEENKKGVLNRALSMVMEYDEDEEYDD